MGRNSQFNFIHSKNDLDLETQVKRDWGLKKYQSNKKSVLSHFHFFIFPCRTKSCLW